MKKLLPVILGWALIAPLTALSEDLVDDTVFKAKCVMCHGSNAEGKTAMKAPALKTVAGKSETELTKAIEEGSTRTTPKMPAFKDKLTPEQIKLLVAEIKALR